MPQPTASIKLNAAAFDVPAMSEIILEWCMTFEHIGHGLKGVIQMRGKSGDAFLEPVASAFIEHRKSIRWNRD